MRDESLVFLYDLSLINVDKRSKIWNGISVSVSDTLFLIINKGEVIA